MQSSLLLEALSTPLEQLASAPLEDVDVAVVDSGVDATHPDLAARVEASFRIDSSDGDPIAREVPLGNNDDFGHGTSVASIVSKVAPNARIIDIRVLDQNNRGSGPELLAGLAHAIKLRCRVINMSLACKAKFAQQLHELCEEAYRANLIVVASKRNMPLVDNGYPAELSSCISVDRSDMPAPYSLRFREGDPIEYAAHGSSVVTAAVGGGYTTVTGTSFATPAVSGFAALLAGRYPTLHPFEIKALLKANSVD